MKASAVDYRDCAASAGGCGHRGNGVDARAAGPERGSVGDAGQETAGTRKRRRRSTRWWTSVRCRRPSAWRRLAGTPEEQALAHEAEKVGDHEVDLAFFDALRTARRKSSAAFAGSQADCRPQEQSRTDAQRRSGKHCAPTRKLAAAPESQKDNLQDQIDVAKAQMDLDQDELDDASGRSGAGRRRSAVEDQATAGGARGGRPQSERGRGFGGESA